MSSWSKELDTCTRKFLGYTSLKWWIYKIKKSTLHTLISKSSSSIKNWNWHSFFDAGLINQNLLKNELYWRS